MNAWNDSIDTKDSTKWASFMNLTTNEWNVGAFPPNVVAIPGALEDGDYDFPPDTIVIQNAGRTELNTRSIEQLIFGVVSGVVLSIMLGWVIFCWRELRRQLRQLRGKVYDPLDDAKPSGNSGSSVTALDDERSASDTTFRKRLALYYDNLMTMPELAEKARGEAVEAEDVEAVNKLLRKMFEMDIEIFSTRNDAGVKQEDIDRLTSLRDSALEEVRRLVGKWRNQHRGATRWDADELKLLQSVDALLWGPHAIQPRSRPQVYEGSGGQEGYMSRWS